MDVGIKNLACSLVEFTFEKSANEMDVDGVVALQLNPWSKLKILDIELIDVVSELAKGKKKSTRVNAKPKTANNLNIHQLCTGIVKILHDRMSNLANVTDILVEQQPFMMGGGSVRMKIIQHCILSFFESILFIKSTITQTTHWYSIACQQIKSGGRRSAVLYRTLTRHRQKHYL